MGSCFSTNNDDSGHHIRRHSPARSNHRIQANKAPPPSMEVETVKEVLSETPKQLLIVKPPLITKLDEDFKIQKELGNFGKKLPPAINNVVEISEVSEICSVTESVSTVTESRDDSGEVCQRVNRSPAKFRRNYRSVSGDLGGRREMSTVGMSPTRRMNQSPGRGNGGGGGGGGGSVRRGGLRNEPVRRDPVEIICRRSRSPATRSNVGQSPVRKTNRAPGLVRPTPFEEKSKTPAMNESLENPLVSLECFIFL